MTSIRWAVWWTGMGLGTALNVAGWRVSRRARVARHASYAALKRAYERAQYLDTDKARGHLLVADLLITQASVDSRLGFELSRAAVVLLLAAAVAISF